jgi:hypothetical protein
MTPQLILAQCNCANGDTPDSVVHNFTLAPTSNFSSTITFPKFDPSIGTLSCVNLSALVTAVSNLSIRNLDSVQRDYQFMYTQAVSFSGPGGLSSFANTSLFYGPTTLDPYNTGVDSVHYGPDTPFKDHGLSRTISNVSAYMGSGTVSINYTNTGSTLLMQGSNNYQSTVSTFAWGEFTLTYYWCTAAALPTEMSFYAIKKDQAVLLQWQTENEIPNTNYEVQLSTDGYRFKGIKGYPKKNAPSSNVAAYELKYEPEANFEGKIFFRIKQTKPSGQVAYSAIRMIDFSNLDGGPVLISPNPVVRDITIGFKSPQSGELRVELLNALGQSIYRNTYKVSATTKLDLRLNRSAQPGIHYLRISNVKTNEQTVQKVIFR